MGCLAIFSSAVLFIAVILGFIVYNFTQLPDIPDIKVTYWGPGKENPDDKTIRPFKINFPDSDLQILKEKLEGTRKLTPPLEGVAFNYGMNTNYLNKFVEFWKTKYNWRDREVYLNKYSQFLTQIGGLNIHFLHVKPDEKKAKGKQVLPLLMMHGWPGSVREFYEIIPLLTTPRENSNFVFEVIAPSLPGYGFSQGASKPELGPAHVGAIFDELMKRLGYSKYYIQGGDWGSIIGNAMAVLYPQRILGFHSNMCFGQTFSAHYRSLVAYIFPSLFMDEDKCESYRKQYTDVLLLETGYFHIQATKPDTVGVALFDSPVGLAAYILEKFSTWTDKAFRNAADGGLEVYNKVELLDNIMIYWLTKSITTSMRFYSEAFSSNYQSLKIDSQPVNVPTACARFPNENLYIPTIVLEGSYTDLVNVTDLEKGGHFAAFEQPQLLADDIWSFVKTLRTRIKQKINNSKLRS